MSRRESLSSLFATVAAASFLSKSANAAVLGFEGKEEKDAEYKAFTVSMILDSLTER